MVCSGWCAVGSGIVGSTGRSLSRSPGVSLFSGLCRSVRHCVLGRGHMVLFRLGVRFSLSLMVLFRLRRASPPLTLVEADRDGVLEVRMVSSVGLASHLPSRAITGWRTRSCVAHYCTFRRSGVMRLTCLGPMHRSVMDVSARRGGQASVGALELRPSGVRQQTLRNTTKTITWKEETS